MISILQEFMQANRMICLEIAVKVCVFHQQIDRNITICIHRSRRIGFLRESG